MNNIICKELQYNSQIWNLKSKQSKDFVIQCLKKNAIDRPDITNLSNDEWIISQGDYRIQKVKANSLFNSTYFDEGIDSFLSRNIKLYNR